MSKSVYTIALDKLWLTCTGRSDFMDDLCRLKNQSTITLQGGIKLIPQNHFLDKTEKEDYKDYKKYTYSFMVTIDDNPVAHFYCMPNRKLQYKLCDASLLCILNNQLYEQDLDKKIKSIAKALNLQFQYYKKLDIAIDGYNLIAAQSQLHKNKQYYRRQKLNNFQELSHDRNKNYVQFTVGSRCSDKYLVFYNKQAEISLSGKQYIKDFWKMNGLIPCDDKQIDRLEIRFKKNVPLDITGNITALIKPGYLAAVFQTYAHKYLEYINSVNPEKRKHIIKWSALKPVTFNKTNTTKSVVSKPQSQMTSIKTLYIEFYRTGLECYKDAFVNLIETYSLHSWFIASAARWHIDYKLSS